MATERSIGERVNFYITRAHTRLGEVESHIANGYFHTAVSRMYYACYYALTALLLQKGVEVKSHAGMRQMLGLHYVKVGLFSDRLSRFFYEIHGYRNDGDYKEFVEFDREFVIEQYVQAIELVNTADTILKQL
jgi:uncharacterized protein (UPF0332 family)